MTDVSNKTFAVIGLGYVGLPLALAFGNKVKTIGFDISPQKISAYESGLDPSGEVESDRFGKAIHLEYTSDESRIREADIVIVAVPTPIDVARQPDLAPLDSASNTVGRNLKPGAIVVYESTVYPSVTEEFCGPILERVSGLKRGTPDGFKLGYSPERINPGDKEHTLEKIIKVVAAEDDETLEIVATSYEMVVEAGVHRASSIQVAEAAKVIENTQRDLNIALMNELAIIFNHMNLDTAEVLEAARTKWNFLPFSPGLVGGHCIGVDPYYLTYKAEMLGLHPKIILAGRRINDSMGKYIAEQSVKSMHRSKKTDGAGRAVVLGLAFKEDCSDLRNTRVIDVINELRAYNVDVVVCDPVVSADEALEEYDITLTAFEDIGKVDVIVACVAHREFLNKELTEYAALKSDRTTPFIDVKSGFSKEKLSQNGFEVWRL